MSKIPTIAMIPSGYKANKVYSVLPTNGDGDLTFARTSTRTRVNEIGLVEDLLTSVPALDYTDGGCPILSLEPASTNLITYSEDFSDASWIKTAGVTLTSNYGISPTGETNSTRVVLSSANEQVYTSIVHSGNTEISSLYIKGVNGETVQFGRGANIGQGSIITLTGGWQRIEQSSTTGGIYIIGNKDGTATDFEIWGAQLEEQDYATSYIPTSGATATRVVETLSKTGLSNYINQSVGVFSCSLKALGDDSTLRLISLTDGSANNRISIGFDSSASNTIIGSVVVGGVATDLTFVATDITIWNNVALKYKSGEISLLVNGVEVATSTDTFTLPVLNTLTYDKGDASGIFYGEFKDNINTSILTSEQLKKLTIQ